MYKFKEWISDMSVYRVIVGGLMILGALFMLLRIVYIHYPLLGYGLGIFTLLYFGAELLKIFNKQYDWVTRTFLLFSAYVVIPFLAFIYHLGVVGGSLTLFKWILCILSIAWIIILLCLINERMNNK